MEITGLGGGVRKLKMSKKYSLFDKHILRCEHNRPKTQGFISNCN